MRGFSDWLRRSPARSGIVGGSGAVAVGLANVLVGTFFGVLALTVVLVLAVAAVLYALYLRDDRRSPS